MAQTGSANDRLPAKEFGYTFFRPSFLNGFFANGIIPKQQDEQTESH